MEVFYSVIATAAVPVSRAEDEENVRIEILEPAYPIKDETNLSRFPKLLSMADLPHLRLP